MIRHRAFSEHGLYPDSVAAGFDALPNFSKWSEAITSQESVTYVFDAPSVAKRTGERVAKMKADKK